MFGREAEKHGPSNPEGVSEENKQQQVRCRAGGHINLDAHLLDIILIPPPPVIPPPPSIPNPPTPTPRGHVGLVGVGWGGYRRGLGY